MAALMADIDEVKRTFSFSTVGGGSGGGGDDDGDSELGLRPTRLEHVREFVRARHLTCASFWGTRDQVVVNGDFEHPIVT